MRDTVNKPGNKLAKCLETSMQNTVDSLPINTRAEYCVSQYAILQTTVHIYKHVGNILDL